MQLTEALRRTSNVIAGSFDSSHRRGQSEADVRFTASLVASALELDTPQTLEFFRMCGIDTDGFDPNRGQGEAE